MQPGRAVSETAKAVVSEVLQHIFEQYPNIARRAGRHDYDGRLPEVTPRAAHDLAKLRAAVRAQVDGLPATADPELRADLDAALAIAEEEHFCLAVLGQDQLGPRDFLAETDVSVYLRRPYAPLAERVAACEAHLAGLPAFLEQAAGTLGRRLPAGDRMRATEHARAQAVNLPAAVRRLVRDHPEHDSAALARAAAAAATACADFAKAVAATAPTNALHGPELLGEVLSVTAGVDRPVAELLDEAQHEVERVTAALDAVVARLGLGAREEAYARLAGHAAAEPVLDSLTAIIARVRDFWVAEDVLSVDTGTPLELRAGDDVAGSARVEFAISPPLEEVRQPHLLTVPEPAESAGAGPDSIRGQYLNDPMLEVIALHEVYAGHYAHLEAGLRGGSLVRTCVPWFPAFTEGWAHYVEELAVERGIADGRPEVEVAQLRSALEAATRLLVCLSVHAGRWTFAEAAGQAARICGWSPARAAREVLVVVADPAGAMYTLGKLRIREWRREVAGSPGGLRAFHDGLMRCGSAPLPAALRYCRQTLTGALS
ncbi:DUF885 family protein [Actinophytocola sp.]|uniref:DUF885 family protein n=1 Tax=Actinophytocola sp. TaxID=1872138 RepID=UPI003899AA11